MSKRRREVRYLIEDEVRALQESIEPNTMTDACDRTIIDLILDTGMQISEVAILSRFGICSTSGTIQVNGKHCRRVPISLPVQESVASYLEWREADPEVNRQDKEALFLDHLGGRLSAQAIRAMLQRRFSAAGIVTLGGRCVLRHTFAVRMARQGTNRHRLQILLGLGSISPTRIYYELA